MDTNTYMTPHEFHALAHGRPARPGKGMLHAQEYASKLEARYAEFLEQLKRAHAIWDYWHEPFSLRLAASCSYRPDFLVQLPNGFLEIHEVKGFFREDAKIKWKLAGERYPCFTFVLIQWVNGQWQEERL